MAVRVMHSLRLHVVTDRFLQVMGGLIYEDSDGPVT